MNAPLLLAVHPVVPFPPKPFSPLAAAIRHLGIDKPSRGTHAVGLVVGFFFSLLFLCRVLAQVESRRLGYSHRHQRTPLPHTVLDHRAFQIHGPLRTKRKEKKNYHPSMRAKIGWLFDIGYGSVSPLGSDGTNLTRFHAPLTASQSLKASSFYSKITFLSFYDYADRVYSPCPFRSKIQGTDIVYLNVTTNASPP